MTVLRRAFPAVLLLALAASPAAAESFQGTFADQGMVLTLHPRPAGDRYGGTLTFDGQVYDLQARRVGDRLRGRFTTEKGSFRFGARFSGEVLELETNTVTYTLRRVVEAGAEPSVPGSAAVPPPEPDPEDGGERDAGLVGLWGRGAIAADAGRRLPGATAVELAAGGGYAVRGGAVERTGRWRTDGPTLLLRPAGSGAWQPYCRFRVIADTLLCSFEDGTRQLWFRQ